MALIDWMWAWDPWRESGGEPGRGPGGSGSEYPPVNVYESAEAYGLEVEVPGVEAADLDLTVEGNVVTVSGVHKGPEGDDAFHRRERPLGRFSRSLRLGSPLDAARVEAVYQDGVLTARLAKAPEAKARKIAVKVG
jgi:HSP20 family protein